MKNLYILYPSLLTILLFSCGGRKETPFPLNETEWLKPKVVPIGKTKTIPLPDSLPNAQYTWKDGKLAERDQSIPLTKPKVMPLGKTETRPTGIEPIPIPKNLPNAEYTTISKKLVKRDQSVPLLPPKFVPLGKTDTFPAIGKRVIAKPPKSVPLGELSMRDNDMFGIRILGQDQGLPGTNAQCMLQDNAGRLWVGTDNGLACLEGNEIKIYNVENGLSSNSVRSLLQDSKGRLWVGTGGGLDLMDLSGGGGFVRYSTENGLSNNSVRCLLEDDKRGLWVGTSGGLNLLDMDGCGQVVHYTTENGLSNNSVRAILHDDKGRLWVGTSGGGIDLLDLGEGGGFVRYSTENGLSNNDVWSVLMDGKGRLWVGTYGGGINLLDLGRGGGFVHYNTENGLSNNSVWSIFEDTKGRLWVGTDGGGIDLLDLDEGGKFVRYSTENGLSNNSVKSILQDGKGRLWVGTDGGLNLLDLSGGARFVHYSTENGLSNNYVRSILQDSKEQLWVGTSGGGIDLLRLNGGGFVNYSTENGLSNNSVWSLFEDSKGLLWIGTYGGGLNILDLKAGNVGEFVHYSAENGLSNNTVNSFLEDGKGNLWAGTWGGGVNLFDMGGAIMHYTLSKNYVRSILEDGKGRLWIGTSGGGINLLNTGEAGGGGFVNYSTDNGLSNNYVWSILEDRKGRIWIGSDGGGLNLFDGGRFIHFTTQSGLADNAVQQVAEDGLGQIWAGTGKGLTRLAEQKDGNFQLKSWTKEHGFKFIDFNGPGNPMIFDKKGTMWTGVGQTLTAFSPPAFDSLAPKLFLTQIDAEGKPADWRKLSAYKGLADTLWLAGQDSFLLSSNFPPDTSWLTAAGFSWEKNDATAPYFLPVGLEVPYSHNHLTFRYSGLKLGEQFDVVYRYMLEGMDEEWSPFTKEGKADYRNIPPGKYTFKVRARNRDYVWSEEKAFSFEVLPPWWQTWWAYTLYFVVIFSAAYAFYRYKMDQVKAQNVKLEKMVAVRTTELKEAYEEVNSQKEELHAQKEELSSTLEKLEVEHQKSESLLLNILPKETADELKEKGYASTKRYERVTVLFTDFKGFTQMAEKMHPEEVVENLNHCFTAFDRICKKHRIEKIKTIGDSYMCAGGIPVADEDNPARTVEAALEMIAFMRAWKAEKAAHGLPVWDLRLGIHTGPVMAGVVGEDKFAYDIWGDTVNTASRMESSGEPSMINISASTYELVKGRFKCTYRGEVTAKNKGQMGMYFVEEV